MYQFTPQIICLRILISYQYTENIITSLSKQDKMIDPFIREAPFIREYAWKYEYI